MSLNVAIIGCGAIARRVHIPVFKSLDNVNVNCVVDADEESARRAAQEQNVGTYYTSFQQALDDKNVDLVSLCTPSFTHSDMIIQAARAGKHILVEKPLALDMKSGKAALEEVRKNNVKLCVVFNFRLFEAAKILHEKIHSGQIGRVVSMIGICHTPFPISWTRSSWLYHYGGALDDAAPHLIDLLLWLNPSQLERVSATGGDFTGNFDFISHIQVGLQFKDTSVATSDISWLNDLSLNTVDVHGTSGRLNCDIRNNHIMETHGQVTSPLDEFNSVAKKSFRITRSMLSGAYFRGGLKYHHEIISGFVNSIVNNTAPPISGEEALMRTAASEAAKMSLKTGRTVYVDELL
jgi:predicted dehydrogenase